MSKNYLIICLISLVFIGISCGSGSSNSLSFSTSLSSWDFGSLLIGTTADKDIVFTNQGKKDFEVSEISLSGINSDAFKILTPATLPTITNPIIVPSKGTLTITIQFTASTPAGYKDSVLNVAHNLKNSPKQIFLTGNAVINANGDYLWAQAWGGDDREIVEGIATDSLNNIYVVGYFEDVADFNPFDDLNVNTNTDVENHTSAGDFDAFLSKFDTNGVWQWSKTWGGPAVDRAIDVVVDDKDNIYVVGDFEQTIDFDPSISSENKTAQNNSRDCYISKFDGSGKFFWVKTWGSNQDDYLYSADIDKNNNIAVCGKFRKTCVFGSETYISNGEGDCFVSKFSSGGSFTWTRTWGGDSPDHATAVCFDPNGSLYVAGFYQKTVHFGQGGLTVSKSSKGEKDCYLVKYSSSGSFNWVNTWGGTDDDWAGEVAADSDSNIYTVGFFRNTVDFDPSGGTDNRISVDKTDCYMVKFDTSANYMYAKTWGNANTEGVWSVSIDTLDNVYIAGEFNGTLDMNPYDDLNPGTTTDVDEFKAKNDDCFFSKYDKIGNYLFTRIFGEIAGDRAYEIFVDQSNYVLVAGYHKEFTDFNPFDDGISTTLGDVDGRDSYGETDAFLSKFN